MSARKGTCTCLFIWVNICANRSGEIILYIWLLKSAVLDEIPRACWFIFTQVAVSGLI